MLAVLAVVKAEPVPVPEVAVCNMEALAPWLVGDGGVVDDERTLQMLVALT